MASLQGVIAGVGLYQVSSEDVYAGLYVRGVHHLVGGVDVAGRYGERDRGDAAVEALDSARIGATLGQYLHLVRDPLALGYSSEVLDELRMADQGRVHDLDRRSLTELRDGVLVTPARHVHRYRYVQSNHDRGLKAEPLAAAPLKPTSSCE